MLLGLRNVSSAQIMQFFRAAYDARSAVVHGSTPRRLRGLDGGEVELDTLVRDLEAVMREALRKALAHRAATASGPWYEWEGTLAKLLDDQPSS